MQRLIDLLNSDALRLEILKAVSSLQLPDCYIGAGFVRNLVWDHLHAYGASDLNDIDVVYYSKQPIDFLHYEDRLRSILPQFHWQLKNQALMHIRNDDRPYRNTVDAMQFWPEIETAVGVRLKNYHDLEVAAPFGVSSLFAGYVTHNPNRSRDIFLKRVESKRWLEKWPKLRVRL